MSEASMLAAWHGWAKGRPPAIQALAARLNPWTVYRLTPTGQLVTLASFSEDGTVTVDVTSELNGPQCIDRQVFGIDPDDLREFPDPPPD